MMSNSWSFTTGQLVAICFSLILFGVCMTMIVISIMSSIHSFIGIISYSLIATLMLMVTLGILRQSRDALKQRYAIRRRMLGSI